MAQILIANGSRVVEASFSDALPVVRGCHAGAGFDRIIVEATCDPAEAALLLKEAAHFTKEPVGVVVIDAETRRRRIEFRAAGYERYVVRPFRPSSLIGKIIPANGRLLRKPQHLPDQDSQQSSRKPGPTVPHAQRVVLIVEDNAINELLAVKVVERAGHQALTARSGHDAVEHMRLALQGAVRMPDAILMDILMPDIDGVETSRHIKALCAAAHKRCPPIIALTAHAFAEDRQRYLDAGLDDYLTKPFIPVELHQVLDKAFRKTGHQRGTAA